VLGVVLGFLATVAAAGQTPAPGPLPAALRTHVQGEQFQVVTAVRGLPLGVRDGLQKLFGSSSLDIADPGAEFQATDVIVRPNLPIRRLASAGCSIDHCLVYYERGGFAHTWQVALFRWTPAATQFEWGADAPGGLATIEDVRKVVLAGTLKGPAKSW
jgi:hypothetical protein